MTPSESCALALLRLIDPDLVADDRPTPSIRSTRWSSGEQAVIDLALGIWRLHGADLAPVLVHCDQKLRARVLSTLAEHAA